MKVIDAHTGYTFDVPLGKITKWVTEKQRLDSGGSIAEIDKNAPTFASHEGGTLTVIAVEPGIFSARAWISHNGGPPHEVPLQIRFTHPHFPFQHVAFIPS